MKLLITLIGVIIANSAFAEDAPMVTERITCADIKAQISELAAIEDATDDELAELEQLKIDYRSKCSRSAAKRKSSAIKNTVVAATVAVPDNDIVTEQATDGDAESVAEDIAEDVIVEDENFVAETSAEIDEQALLEQELANLDAGLCVDGTKPNKFGCCTGEVFKDLGNSVFACCPKTGDGECFPPIE